jgi:hypothetical protein
MLEVGDNLGTRERSPKMQLLEPYAKRPVRPLGLFEHDGWRLKVYGIRYGAELPDADLVEAAQRLAAERLPDPAGDGTEERYGVGFLGVHEGRGSDFVFLDWWQNENELHHHTWVAPKGRPIAFEYVTPTGLSACVSACVWDLSVICFERQAWLEDVLANPAGPDVEAYLGRTLDGMV